MTSTSSSLFRLRVLGAPELVDGAGQTPPALGWGKPLALLCYLAVRGEARRDEIVDLLWRGVEEGKARNAFRQALHRLRTALGDELIPRERDRLRLGQSERLSVDIVDFEEHVRSGHLDQAVALCAGDFLEGSELGEPAFDHWAEQERTRLRGRFRQVLQDAVIEASNAGRWADAIARAKRLQNLAPFEPDAAKLAATTLLSAGRRVEALELLRQFAQRTEGELGIPVHPDVQALIARLSREALTTPSASRAQSSAPGDIASLSFVGRETELSQLVTLWQTIGDDAGALALIEGEAGIGKTRLVQELIANARSLGPVLAISGRERAAGAQLPYGIFGESLRPLVRAPGVAGASAHLLAEAARLLPEMRDSFDLPQVSPVEDDASRLRFFEGVAALIDAAAYEQRMLVVLEELQYIPPSSLDLLFYLATRLAGAPVMFVLTIRPADASPGVLARLRALAGSADGDGNAAHGARGRRFSLAPLGSEASVAALRDVAQSAGIAPSHFERIARVAGGNPLRLLHAARAVAGGEELSSSPAPLRDLLLDRLQRLSSTQRRIFLVLALLGRPATVPLLSAAAHVPESSCRDAVRVLRQVGLVEQTDLEASVANALAAEVAFDVAGGAGRAFLSGWIAEALAREPGVEPAELARLYAAAGNASQAFRHARRAAFEFLANGAVPEATQLFALARTFATSPEEHAEVEGALDALGSGRRRLPVGAQSASEMRSGETKDWEREPPPISRRRTPAAPAPGRWQRLFPNWRVLFGAALATLLVSAAVLGMRSRELVSLSARSLDTLVVSEGIASSPGSRRMAIGNLRTGFVLGPRIDRAPSDPPWVDSLSREWTSPIPSPRGVRVAVSRRTPRGEDLYVIARDRRDSLALLVEHRSAVPLGWSPDGNWLLAGGSRATASVGFDVGLLAIRMFGGGGPIPIDTTQRHAVTEALWSPDGSHIAWVARMGADRQLEVFASLADGSGVRNVSRHAGEDYHITWSPDGQLLAFTSTRDGNPELYAVGLLENRLWRLTQDGAHDDRAAFSPDGRSLAFESTRGGALGVYVMPALGGEPRRVGGGTRLEIVGWRGPRPRFVDHVRADVGDLSVGDSAVLRLRAFDESGDSITLHKVEWRVLDTTFVRFTSDADTTSPARTVRGFRPGLARVAATIGRWRSDTAFVRVGSERISLLQETFADLTWWRALGNPPPTLAGNGDGRSLLLRASRDWDSGALSRATVPMAPGLSLTAMVEAPWNVAPDIATEANMALVVPEEDAAIDTAAPQFLKLASVSWKADAGRLVYAVGKEVFSEPVGASPARSRRLAMTVEDDSTVTFSVDDQTRWRSTLRLTTPRAGARAQIWISGRATAEQVRVTSVSVALAAKSGARPRE